MHLLEDFLEDMPILAEDTYSNVRVCVLQRKSWQSAWPLWGRRWEYPSCLLLYGCCTRPPLCPLRIRLKPLVVGLEPR